MAKAKPFIRTVCKCERCGHEWIPQSENVYTCAKCRSPYWNKPKDGSNPIDKVLILDEKGQLKAALQCAIYLNFECENYKQHKVISALCNTCFESPFWEDSKIKQLKEAFSTETKEIELVDKSNEVIIQPDEVYDMQDTNIKDEDLPKTAEEALAKLEAKEIKIVGREKINDLSTIKTLCYECKEKYKDDDGDWQCNFLYYKQNPPYEYCRLCWELAEIWGSRAVGLKK